MKLQLNLKRAIICSETDSRNILQPNRKSTTPNKKKHHCKSQKKNNDKKRKTYTLRNQTLNVTYPKFHSAQT
jgi:hypothetical protein